MIKRLFCKLFGLAKNEPEQRINHATLDYLNSLDGVDVFVF